MSYETAEGEDAPHVLRRHSLVRKEGSLPFIPFGLIPAAGLGITVMLALGPLAWGIQGATKRAVSESLAAADIDWADPSVSGQMVTLHGEPPSAEAAREAERIARAAAASTPFGLARPATRVTVPQGPFKVKPDTPADPPPSPPPATGLGDVTDEAASSPSWKFVLSNGTLRLTGTVPDRATKDALVRQAYNKIYPPRIQGIEDNLQVANTEAPAGYIQVALRGVNTVSRCDTGRAEFEQGRFSLRCELPDSEAEAVRAQAIASVPFGTVDRIDILPNEAVESCEEQLSSLLDTARIEFDSNSAIIDGASNDLLDRVAAAVRDCPGTLRIEGHTDSTGTDDENLTLSRNRAFAVRSALIARNVNPKNLIAEGYGASRPVSSNTSPEGRARNRRIEIRVVRVSE